MIALYVAALLFGGGLLAGSLLGGGDQGGDADAPSGSDGAAESDALIGATEHGAALAHVQGHGRAERQGQEPGQEHGHSSAGPLWFVFSLRFWSFATAFFGLTGLVLRALGGSAMGVAAPIVSAVVGVAAGATASRVFGKLTREAVGQLRDAGALIGREGRLLLPVTRAQRGKVRLPLTGGGHLDLVAQASDDDPLPAATEVLVVELKGNVAVVARSPAALPPAATTRGGD